ncbi:MAG: hypothetical protein RB191_11370, partial [Terriglobia bacterium]|nr:hypothetical protein [Terriglobia bacterium]
QMMTKTMMRKHLQRQERVNRNQVRRYQPARMTQPPEGKQITAAQSKETIAESRPAYRRRI